ncbi:antibiotic biosynthesis monooxygenase [Rhizobium deserti]|uniref:Antibiotic biosynthesis monooxygenase n=1 Tax=Rhizobium deserti TaxID=2547961 RepID=A0A4R5U727_9HYPH|nr:putative quinol monooxygenase [Rhizobium deserti]TDK29863.1 antibiotic biosynthesis monooxygenase [Rhizobium deserti]
MSVPLTDQTELIALLKAKPEKRAALFDALAAIVPEVRKEDGCLRYDLHVDRDDPDMAVMLESWRDESALNAHAAGAPFQSLTERLDDLLAEPLRLHRLQRLA